MANENGTPLEEQVAKLYLDEATGEKVSKSELKRRMKQREKDAEREARKATAAPTEKTEKAEDEEDLDDDIRYMDGDEIDLEGPIRDGIILNLPLNPLCKADCQGLCPDCGEKIENLPSDHAHEKVDERWAALGDLKERLTEENKRKK